jgi:hypothetical protein
VRAVSGAGEVVVIQLEAGRVEDFVLFIDDAVVDAVEAAGFGNEILPGGTVVTLRRGVRTARRASCS